MKAHHLISRQRLADLNHSQYDELPLYVMTQETFQLVSTFFLMLTHGRLSSHFTAIGN